MGDQVFVSADGAGLVRARKLPSGNYQVDRALTGPTVRCLARNPLNPIRAYAGAEGAGVLVSQDWGASWQPLGLAGQTVTAVAASPTEDGVIYAGTRPARVYVSRDGGASWSELAGFRRIRGRRFWFSPAEKPFAPYPQGIALSPTDPARIVVGVEFGATVVSEDGGKTWSNHLKGSLRDCHGLVFHSTDGNWVYEAGGTGGGAAFSRDGGRTWTNAGAGLDRHYGWGVTFDPADPSVWYVSVSLGPGQTHGEGNAEARIFRRDGAGWRALAGGLPQPLQRMPYALMSDANTSGTLYAGLSDGEVWGTRDYGESWERLPVGLGSIRRTAVML